MTRVLTERDFMKLKEEGVVKVEGITLRRMCQNVQGEKHSWTDYDLLPTEGLDGVMCISRTCAKCGYQQKEEIPESTWKKEDNE